MVRDFELFPHLCVSGFLVSADRREMGPFAEEFIVGFFAAGQIALIGRIPLLLWLFEHSGLGLGRLVLGHLAYDH